MGLYAAERAGNTAVAIGATLGNSVTLDRSSLAVTHHHRRRVRPTETVDLLVPVLVLAIARRWCRDGPLMPRSATGFMSARRKARCSGSAPMCCGMHNECHSSDVRARRAGDIAAHLTSDATVIAPRLPEPVVSLVFAQAFRLAGLPWRSCSPLTGAWAPSRSARYHVHALMATRLRGTITVVPVGACRTPSGGCRPCSPTWSGALRDIKAANRQTWAGRACRRRGGWAVAGAGSG